VKKRNVERPFLFTTANSGVTRVSCALGQEIFLRPLSTKSTEFEEKIGEKVFKKQRGKFFSFFQKIHILKHTLVLILA